MNALATILVVDDDDLILQSCKDVLQTKQYRPVLASNGEQAIEYIGKEEFDIIITDLKMQEKDGLDVLRFAKEREPNVPVIILTGYPTMASAIEAMRLGAFDFICKPATPDELLMVVNRALENRRLIAENQYLRQHTERKGLFGDIICQSESMQDVLRQVEKVAPTESTVLLIGESGVGKEVVARAIHRNSPRKGRQFVVADCAALAAGVLESELFGHVKGAFTGATASRPGLFEVARGGTLFLDELANIHLETQSKLLRVIENREYKPVGSQSSKSTDARIVAATNCDLEEKVKEGTFRQDLFFRLNVFPIRIPPLRERREDIVPLAKHFLQHFSTISNRAAPHFDDEALEKLKAHSWPGNVRELKNVVEQAVIMAEGPTITDTKVPQQTTLQPGSEAMAVPQTANELNKAKKDARKKAVDKIERSFIIQALQRADGNISRAARETGMQRTYFQVLMKRHGLSQRDCI